LKRRIKGGLKSLKNCVSKLKVIQKILPARLRALWFGASIISSAWFLYWICYDLLVWNKGITQSRPINYVAFTLSIVLVILGTQLGKLGILEKLTLFLQQHIHKEATENQHATEEKQIKPIKQAQQTRPAKKKVKRRIKRSLKSLKNCVSKLKVSKRILLVIAAMLKQASLHLKLKLSAFFQSMSALKTRMINMVPHGLRIINFVTKKGKKIVLLLGIVASLVLNLFLLSTISGQLATRTQMYSYGSIQIQTVGIAAYRDAGCTTTASEIPWGTLAPGSSGEYVFYIKNEGTSSLNLFLNTENWSPTNAANYITLSWNYGGQKVAPNQAIQITLTLTVSQSISGIDSFGFDIVLTGTDAS
jgi:hypothetical protein